MAAGDTSRRKFVKGQITGIRVIPPTDFRRLMYGLDQLAERPVTVEEISARSETTVVLRSELPQAEQRLFAALGRLVVPEDKYYPRNWTFHQGYACRDQEATGEVGRQHVCKDAQMTDIGIKQVAERIHSRLQRYLEAQYHIKDRALIEERHLLLLEAGAIAQRPFVEVTPSYAVETGFSTLKIPQPISDLLTELGGFRPSDRCLSALQAPGRCAGSVLRQDCR